MVVLERSNEVMKKREREEPCHICQHYHDVSLFASSLQGVMPSTVWRAWSTVKSL